MKIIHYIPSLNRKLGGVAMYMQLLAKELGKICDLTVVTRPSENPLVLENCKTIQIPRDKNNFIRKWNEVLDEVQPDLVHINGIWQLDTWWIQKEALKKGIPTYITVHGMLAPWILNRNKWKKKLALWVYQKKALQSAKLLIATADKEYKWIKDAEVTSTPITVIPSGIDLDPIIVKKNWSQRKKILYLARIHEVKGIELLLDAAIAISEKLCNYDIIIAGEGDSAYVAELKSKAEESRLHVTFAGGVYGDDKWELYRNADFFVLPTQTENFGFVIAEALACGTPVITTKGAPWEPIETYKCGKWIDRTEENLGYAMLEMLSKNAKELESMGRNGRKLIEEKYSAKVMADSLMNIYKNKE